MNKILVVTLLMFFFVAINAQAQLSTNDAIKAMGRGINMGNTLEPPNEGDWGNTATESNFDDYKNAGFSCVRLPITWDKHTNTVPPYSINSAWLNRIEQIVDWGLSRHLMIIINAHHEGWIKSTYTPNNIARFDSIWSQIATRFKNKSDSLLFEVINEPHPLSLANVNDLNSRTIRTIRKTNPTRIVLFSGDEYSNSDQLIAAAIPDTADHYLIGYYHSYDPYPFGLNGPGTYGSDIDINTTIQKFNQVATWDTLHHVSVVLSEFAYTYKCEYNSRMCAYATVAEQAQVHHVPCMVWEDGGDFKFYNRTQHTWSEIKDVLIHTYIESPNKMKISAIADTLIKIQWNNRTTMNDSIIIERKIGTGSFTFFAKISNTASEFIDTTTSRGKTFYYRLRASLKDSIEIQSYPVMLRIPSMYRAPYSGIPVSIPGKVECENYDIGGEGLAYHDVDEVNSGGAYRNDGVDIKGHSGLYYISDVAAGEWLEYTINVQQSGLYTISVNYAAQDAGGSLTLAFPNTPIPKIYTTTATGGESIFTQMSKSISLNAGVQIMRLAIGNWTQFYLDNITFSLATSVAAENAPTHFQLMDNYPNPFNPSTTISFSLPSEYFVKLKIFDAIGREVATIFSGKLEAGKYTRQWNAEGFPSGVYFSRLEAGSFVDVKKLVLVK
jgi:aryl-phospho-beta-D-glucosidase BglC (GH1 family)